MHSYIPLILFVVSTNALSQILLKHGMNGIGAFEVSLDNFIATSLRILLDPYVVAGLITMTGSMALHLYVLSRVPLTFAFPFISVSYIVILATGALFFGEKLSAEHYIGTLLIIAGIFFIGRAGGAG